MEESVISFSTSVTKCSNRSVSHTFIPVASSYHHRHPSTKSTVSHETRGEPARSGGLLGAKEERSTRPNIIVVVRLLANRQDRQNHWIEQDCHSPPVMKTSNMSKRVPFLTTASRYPTRRLHHSPPLPELLISFPRRATNDTDCSLLLVLGMRRTMTSAPWQPTNTVYRGSITY